MSSSNQKKLLVLRFEHKRSRSQLLQMPILASFYVFISDIVYDLVCKSGGTICLLFDSAIVSRQVLKMFKTVLTSCEKFLKASGLSFLNYNSFDNVPGAFSRCSSFPFPFFAPKTQHVDSPLSNAIKEETISRGGHHPNSSLLLSSTCSSGSISRPPELGGRRPPHGPVIRVFPAITALRRCLLKPSRSSLRLPMVLVFSRLRRTKNAAVVVVVVTDTANHATTRQGDSVKVKDIHKHHE